MASEIRVNNIKALTGLGTVTVSADGINVGGIATATSFVGDVTGAVTGTASNASGATGDFSIADKIIHTGDTDTAIRFPAADTFTVETGGSERLRINSDGDILPGADATQDLGATDKRFANIYSADLQLSNEGSSNDVDGTWGKYTIQEGEDDLFLINRRTGKKYKFILEEV